MITFGSERVKATWQKGSNTKCSCFCSFFSMLLLCSFFRLKESSKVKNGLSMK